MPIKLRWLGRITRMLRMLLNRNYSEQSWQWTTHT